MTRYSISAKQLLKTSNQTVLNSLSDNVRDHRVQISDDKIVLSHPHDKNGLEKYIQDGKRGVLLDNIHFYLNLDPDQHYDNLDITQVNTSEEDFLEQIGNRQDKLKSIYSQDIYNLVLSWMPYSQDIHVKPKNLKSNISNEIFTEGGRDYLRISISHFEIKAKSTYDDMENIGIFPVNLEITYELTDQGCELINITTDSLRLIHYYLEDVKVDKFLKDQHLLFLQDGVKNITNLLALKDKYDQQIQSISYAYISKHKYPKLDKFRSLFTPKPTNPPKEYIKPTHSQREYINFIAEIARAQLFALSKMISTNSNELTQQDLKLITDIKNPQTDMNHFLTRDLNIPQTQLDILLNKIPTITPRGPSRSANT